MVTACRMGHYNSGPSYTRPRACEFPRTSFLERLSGKSLCGSNGAFVGSAKRPKRCHFAPFCRLKGPRNEACSEFPDSLSKDDSRKLRRQEGIREPGLLDPGSL